LTHLIPITIPSLMALGRVTMEHEQQNFFGVALAESNLLLRRWNDVFTRQHREDFAQEAAFAAVLQCNAMRKPAAFPSLVRVITRRMRARAIHRHLRLPECVAESDLRLLPMPEPLVGSHLLVAGRLVPQAWLVARLEGVLPRLSQLNRMLLLGFYEGFSCGELGDRMGLSEMSVKVRIHRSRGLLRKKIERMVRAADQFES
jgi:DNA-directed RNA polymerase specialized sigma24 family protein